MAKETVQIRIDEKTSRFVELMLRTGLFNTKSDAIRYLLSKGVSASMDLPEIARKVDKLRSIEESTRTCPIELRGSLEGLLTGRDRFS